MSADEKHPEEEPNSTAFEEVLKEILDAERRTEETEEQGRHRGEAGEAITPNAEAQEESRGEPDK
ncbi:hypothetical protein ACWC10_15730 [Streptomyces sp. NPDC001595]|uniref:hypothetical protein n=1 Tax=Streptomyces sp. NPDC001532 TaxID=3154520 RepID=UPI0033318A11